MSGYLVLIKSASPTPLYWLGWTSHQPTELTLQLILTSAYPIELLWATAGEEDEDELLTYPYIQYWIPDSDWFELPDSAVAEICGRGESEK